MTIRRTLLALTFVVIGLVIGCSKSDQPGNAQQSPLPTGSSCDGINAKFATDVSPIIQTKCATGSGCHGAGSNNGPGELLNFNEIKNAASTIKTDVISGRMPLVGSLSTAQINQISCWVNNGTLDN